MLPVTILQTLQSSINQVNSKQKDVDIYKKDKIIRSHFGGRIALKGAQERVMGMVNSGPTFGVRRGGSSRRRGGQGSARRQ